jgi:hypothetical protein
MLANVSVPNDVPNDALIEPDMPNVPKKRKRKSGGARHRKRDTFLGVVEAALAVIDWDDKVDGVARVGDRKLHDMNADIKKEFANLFEEPTGLPLHRPGIGDFQIRLIPAAPPPYRSPYR